MPVAPPYSIMINKNVSRYWQMSLEGKIAPSWEPLDITLEKDNWFYVPWDSSTNSNDAQAVVFHKSLTLPILPRLSQRVVTGQLGKGPWMGDFFAYFLGNQFNIWLENMLALIMYNVLYYGRECHISRIYFPSCWECSWKTAPRETCFTQGHTCSQEQPESNHCGDIKAHSFPPI